MAWSVPVIAVVSAAPAFAASGFNVAVDGTCTPTKPGGDGRQLTINVTFGTLPAGSIFGVSADGGPLEPVNLFVDDELLVKSQSPDGVNYVLLETRRELTHDDGVLVVKIEDSAFEPLDPSAVSYQRTRTFQFGIQVPDADQSDNVTQVTFGLSKSAGSEAVGVCPAG